jgi:ribosome recycling factor
LDLSVLHDGVADALKRLKDDLSKLRAGGRLNPDVIENLRVHLKGDKESVRLGDLAQVIPKGGRTLTIMVGEEDVSIAVCRL